MSLTNDDVTEAVFASDTPADDSPVAAIEAAIMGRRTVKQFAAKPVPREIITTLIDRAVWAPNHRLTEPWRFYIFDGESRTRLGEVAAAVTREKVSGSGAAADVVERKAQEAAQTWANVPVLLYITTVIDPRPDVDLENYGAVCCAIQNLTLLAHAMGLGMSWSSGAVAEALALRTLAGAGENERMVGLLRLGYPDPAATAPSSRRTPGTTHTSWVDDATSGAAS